MNDDRRSFADDFDEFDHLLVEDDVPVSNVATKTKATRTVKTPKISDKKRLGSVRQSVRVAPDWNRLAAVLFVVLIVLFIVWFAISSIRDSRRNGAYEDYFGSVRALAAQSDAQGDEMDSIVTDPNGGDRSERIARVEDLATRADKLAKKASAMNYPNQLADAHESMVLSMELRATGIDAFQRALSASVDNDDKDASTEAIAQSLARLVASDVIWADKFAVQARSRLSKDEVEGVAVPDSVVMDDFDTLAPKSISAMLDRLAVATKVVPGGSSKVPNDGKIRGGQLESGSVTITPSGQTLAVGALTKIKGGDNVTFEVPFTNQGEVQLTQVPVKITMRGSESDPVVLTGLIDVVDPGQTATAKVALDEVPNFGEVLETEILVGPIPGEKTADNNKGSYQIQFSL